MSLNSNALTSVRRVEAYMGRTFPESDLLRLFYNPAVGDASAITLKIEEDSTWTFTITGGAQAGTIQVFTTLHTSMTSFVAALQSLISPLVVQFVSGTGTMDPAYITYPQAVQSIFGGLNSFLVRGRNSDAMETCINASSNLMERWCCRAFKSASYKQLYHGNGRRSIQTKNYPVTAIARVCVGTIECLQIRNTSTDALDATVANNGTSVTLVVIGGANASSNSVTISTNTITQLAALITALGKGWSVSVSPATGGWPASELFKFTAQGAMFGFVSMVVPERSISGYSLESTVGILRRESGPQPASYQNTGLGIESTYPVRTDGSQPPGAAWTIGRSNVMIQYTAGYSTIPSDLEEIAIDLSAAMYRGGFRDPTIVSEAGPGYSYTADVADRWLSTGLRNRLVSWRRGTPVPETVDV